MNTKYLAAISALVCIVGIPAANAATDAASIKKTIVDAIAKDNKGDEAGFFAAFAKDGTVIDEFAPFRWTEPGEWGKGFDSWSQQNNITGSAVKILKFAHVNIEGDRAYAVASAVYSFKQGAKLRKEPGTEVFTLGKDGAAWKIDSFAWFGKTGVDGGTDANAIIAAANGFAQTASASPAPAVIVDEFAPYHWVGASAQDDWGGALKALMTKTGGTDMALKLDAPSQLNVNSSAAYAVFPTTITSKAHGRPEIEKGAFAMAFAKDGGWHIVSWAWATK